MLDVVLKALTTFVLAMVAVFTIYLLAVLVRDWVRRREPSS